MLAEPKIIIIGMRAMRCCLSGALAAWVTSLGLVLANLRAGGVDLSQRGEIWDNGCTILKGYIKISQAYSCQP